MAKRLLVSFFAILFLACPLLYADVSRSDIAGAIDAFLDCVSATIVCHYSPNSFYMPSSAITVYSDTHLPARISFFLADPSEFVESIQNNMKRESGNIFSSFISFLNRSEDDPFVTALYFVISNRDYKDSDYIINGSISFTYPYETSVTDLTSIWTDRNKTGEFGNIDVDISILGKKLPIPLVISGNFRLFVNDDKKIEVIPVDEYMLNGVTYSNGVFRF